MGKSPKERTETCLKHLRTEDGDQKGTLTDVEGIQDVTGPLRVVAAAPDVDGVFHQHSRVAVAHVGHLPGTLPASGAHWRQLCPAQRHCQRDRQEKGLQLPRLHGHG